MSQSFRVWHFHHGKKTHTPVSIEDYKPDDDEMEKIIQELEDNGELSEDEGKWPDSIGIAQDRAEAVAQELLAQKEKEEAEWQKEQDELNAQKLQAQKEKVERNKQRRKEAERQAELADKNSEQNTPHASPQMKSSIRMSARLAKVNEKQQEEARMAYAQIGDEVLEVDVNAPRQLRDRNSIKKPETFAPENFKDTKKKEPNSGEQYVSSGEEDDSEVELDARGRPKRNRAQTQRFNPHDPAFAKPARKAEQEESDSEESEETSESEASPSPVKKKSNRQRRSVSKEVGRKSSKGRSKARGSTGGQRDSRRRRRRRAASSDGSSSDDEFSARLRDPHSALDKDGQKVVNADVKPVEVDASVTWRSIGGMEQHVNQVKEVVMLPLMYPEMFAAMSLDCPKGMLFHGPPGTGKTLMARALAGSCKANGVPISFFMRSGGDVLSKYVGEAEKSLKALFEEAKRCAPSIIFFDEIDGIAPVRSSKNDQTHASIVATLLALMDGMQGRGQVIVLGATNRPDNVDPGLRRPGRFDRELYFGLPGTKERIAILKVHTKEFQPPLSDQAYSLLGDRTAGFTGADLRAICTESAYAALRRTFPQIYQTDEKLKLPTSSLRVMLEDFMTVLRSSRFQCSQARHGTSVGRALQPVEDRLFKKCLEEFSEAIAEVAPFVNDKDAPVGQTLPCGIVFQSREDFVSDFIAPAWFNTHEILPCFRLDATKLDADESGAVRAIAQTVQNAVRASPAIIYIPGFHVWSEYMDNSRVAALRNAIESMPRGVPVLMIITENKGGVFDDPNTTFSTAQPCEAEKIYEIEENTSREERAFRERWFPRVELDTPENSLRVEFVQDKIRSGIADAIIGQLRKCREQSCTQGASATLEVDQNWVATLASMKINPRDVEEEDRWFRTLRLQVREILEPILANQRFKEFLDPVDETRCSDYREYVNTPMCLNWMVDKCNALTVNCYTSLDEVKDDLNLVHDNCMTYNGDDVELDDWCKELCANVSHLKDVFLQSIDCITIGPVVNTMVKRRQQRKEIEKKAAESVAAPPTPSRGKKKGRRVPNAPGASAAKVRQEFVAIAKDSNMEVAANGLPKALLEVAIVSEMTEATANKIWTDPVPLALSGAAEEIIEMPRCAHFAVAVIANSVTTDLSTDDEDLSLVELFTIAETTTEKARSLVSELLVNPWWVTAQKQKFKSTEDMIRSWTSWACLQHGAWVNIASRALDHGGEALPVSSPVVTAVVPPPQSASPKPALSAIDEEMRDVSMESMPTPAAALTLRSSSPGAAAATLRSGRKFAMEDLPDEDDKMDGGSIKKK